MRSSFLRAAWSKTIKYPVAIPFKWGQVSYIEAGEYNLALEVVSQSLLNEVKFPTARCSLPCVRCCRSQSLLNEVKFPTFKGIRQKPYPLVAIPFKWGQVSYRSSRRGKKQHAKSQSLLNEVKFPTMTVFKVSEGVVVVAIPFKWGQVSYYISHRMPYKYQSQSLLNEVKFPTYKLALEVVNARIVAIPFKWGQVSYSMESKSLPLSSMGRNPF